MMSFLTWYCFSIIYHQFFINLVYSIYFLLDFLKVDERAVLKHFDWPEKKADALREAAFGYCDLKKLECEVSSFHDDRRQHWSHVLKKIQSLFEK